MAGSVTQSRPTNWAQRRNVSALTGTGYHTAIYYHNAFVTFFTIFKNFINQHNEDGSVETDVCTYI